MKVKITLLYVQCNTKLNINHENHVKVFVDENNTFPHKYISAKNEKQTLKELCEEYFKLDFNWMIKNLADFRINRVNGENIAEVVYTIYAPEVIGIEKKGRLLSLRDLQEHAIGVDDFYERILTSSGRTIFR